MDFVLEFNRTEIESAAKIESGAAKLESDSNDIEGDIIILESDGVVLQGMSPTMPTGEFTLKLVNRLPFAIRDCKLVIGITQSTGLQVDSHQDVYQTESPGLLPAGATFEKSFDASFQVDNGRNEIKSWRGGYVVTPKVSHLGKVSAWIIGDMENSPFMKIDKQRSDFSPREQFHIFVQEIFPEHMPDPSVFLDTGSKSGDLPVEDNSTTDGSPER